jgi:hypothetical protein
MNLQDPLPYGTVTISARAGYKMEKEWKEERKNWRKAKEEEIMGIEQIKSRENSKQIKLCLKW